MAGLGKGWGGELHCPIAPCDEMSLFEAFSIIG